MKDYSHSRLGIKVYTKASKVEVNEQVLQTTDDEMDYCWESNVHHGVPPVVDVVSVSEL